MALVSSIALIVLYAYEGRGTDIWYDEVFSLVFSSGGISDAIRLTGMDVHPPLYYIYLILFNKLAILFYPEAVIPLCKLASLVPWLFILIAGYAVIKKRYGYFTYGIFMLMITGMPQVGNYYIEIRMYSLALAIITLAGLETLSIIAYKQPITRLEIERIRGVSCDHAINRLLEYDLITELGRKDAPGRPLLFGTTEQFLRSFGVKSLDELPEVSMVQIEEFKQQAEEEIQMTMDI